MPVAAATISVRGRWIDRVGGRIIHHRVTVPSAPSPLAERHPLAVTLRSGTAGSNRRAEERGVENASGGWQDESSGEDFAVWGSEATGSGSITTGSSIRNDIEPFLSTRSGQWTNPPTPGVCHPRTIPDGDPAILEFYTIPLATASRCVPLKSFYRPSGLVLAVFITVRPSFLREQNVESRA